MVAVRAREFCSSQNCTAFSSSMRFSSSSTLMVGATQLERLGSCGMLFEAPLARLCRKSKPGTSLPKPKLLDVSLMAAPQEMDEVNPGQVPKRRSLLQCAAAAKAVQ